MLTIVMPAYNEEGIIRQAVMEWHDEVVVKISGSKIIVVDDCSKDSTGTIVQTLSNESPAIQYLRMPRNGGHGRALRWGFQHVTSEWVFQTDSDRQHVPSDFWKLWESRSNYDFVFGIRENRADGHFRKVITSFMRAVNFVLWGTWIRDANCPFKLMRRQPLDDILARIPEDCFIPMVGVSLLSRKLGYRISEVLVTHLPRRGGTQSLKGIARWVRVGIACTVQLLKLRLTYKSRLNSTRVAT